MGPMSVAARHWRLLDPPGAVVVTVPHQRAASGRAAATVNRMARGTHVVLEAGGWGARRRCRRFLRRAGLEPEQEFLAIPSLRRTAFRVEDTPAARAHFAATFLMPPPNLGRLSVVADVAVAVARPVARTRLFGICVPGRVVMARRR
jgi:hypothetical protein